MCSTQLIEKGEVLFLAYQASSTPLVRASTDAAAPPRSLPPFDRETVDTLSLEIEAFFMYSF